MWTASRLGRLVRVVIGLLVLVFVVSRADAADKDLLAHWPLSGDLQDHSGHGRHAVNRGARLDGEGPAAGTLAASFDGRSGGIEVPVGALDLGARPFTLSMWVHADDASDDVPGDLMSFFDAEKRRGFNLGVLTQTGVTTSQSNWRNLVFGIDDGQASTAWTDLGRPGNAVLIFALAVHQGDLFAGTCEAGGDQVGHVYRLDDQGRWEDLGLPAGCNSVSALAEFQGGLYAGTARYRLRGSALKDSENPKPGGQVFRWKGGSSWEDCGTLPGSDCVAGLVVYRGSLYASSLYSPGMFRYLGGKNWESCGSPNGKRVEALGVWNGGLYATSYDSAEVYRYDGGERWTNLGRVGPAENTQTYGFAVHEGNLFVSTWRTGRVFRFDGPDRWRDTGRLGEELEVMGMSVYNGKLYAGTLPLAEVYRFDGENQWANVGRLDHTPDVTYRRAWVMAVHRGRLVCGTLPSGKVLAYQAGRCASWDHALGTGWHHLAAVRAADRLRVHVDGRQVAESSPFEAKDYRLSLPDHPLRIGRGANDVFLGRIADVRIHGRALDPAEIQELVKLPPR